MIRPVYETWVDSQKEHDELVIEQDNDRGHQVIKIRPEYLEEVVHRLVVLAEEMGVAIDFSLLNQDQVAIRKRIEDKARELEQAISDVRAAATDQETATTTDPKDHRDPERATDATPL